MTHNQFLTKKHQQKGFKQPHHGIKIHNLDVPEFQKKQCTDAELKDILSYLKRIQPKSRFNAQVQRELAQLIYNLKLGNPFKYSVGQSHTISQTLKNKMFTAGLMDWDGGYHIANTIAKKSVAKPTSLFFAVINRHCQLKQGDGHIGYYDDPRTMRELAEFNAFMAQHTMTYTRGHIDHTHRFNYVRTRDGQGIIRQRLISHIHSMKKELRPFIEINGIPTSRFDVTATHPQLLLHKYANASMSFDPYDIAPDQEYGANLRSAAKLATMMMINTSDRKAAGAAFRKELRDPDNKAIRMAVAHVTGSQIDILDMVCERNPLLRPYFYKGLHRELMHMDGNIAWNCMRRLADQGIPSLSVHDEFIVQCQNLETALKVYKQCWIEETGINGLGIEPMIKIKD